MPIPSTSPAAAHFKNLARLIDLEAEAEKQEDLQAMQRHQSAGAGAEASGQCLVNLVIRNEDAGLGGSVVLTLGKRNQTLPIPWTRLGAGSPVLFSVETSGGEPGGWRGVVSRLQRETIQVSFAEWPDLDAEGEPVTFRLDRSSDEISRQRQRAALDRAAGAADGSRLAELREVLLGGRAPVFLPPGDGLLTPAQSSALNPSQQEAVRFALSAEDVAILHGPPGTGKTTTLVEIIRSAVGIGQSVLAVAPSNIAVDNLLERLLAAGLQPIRLGNPARVLPELRAHTLDGLLENHPDMRLARKLTREAYALRKRAARFTRARPEPGERQAQRREAKQMLADARQIEDQLVDRLIGSAMVICATATGLDRRLLGGRVFDWCVLDEASQGTEPVAWIPLQYARRLVLAGDPFQLPPTILSAEAIAGGLRVSLMERLMDQFGPILSRRLDVQYRMHQDIMAFSSAEFYEGSLVASPTVRAHLLCDLPGIAAVDLTAAPVDFIDTAGASYDEEVEPEGESRFNPLEADLVANKVRALLEAGLAPGDLAVISPYSAQVRLLRQKIRQAEIEIDSVDGFQGREKEAVIVSLVRSNPECEIGFLEDVRRMNVALTRARRKLIVIGDSATIGCHPFYQRMLAYFDRIGAYHSVWEES